MTVSAMAASSIRPIIQPPSAPKVALNNSDDDGSAPNVAQIPSMNSPGRSVGSIINVKA